MDTLRLVLLILAVFFLLKSQRVKEAFLPLYGYLTGSGNRLYDLLGTVHTLFSKHCIPYAITGEVLLSAVEKQRLTRGQNQATILIPHDSIGELLGTSDELKQMGLGLSDIRDGGFVLSSAMTLPGLMDTSVAILPVQPAGDRWITDSKYHGYDEWYGAKELFPAKLYKLGSLDVSGPADPINYLHRNFWSLGIKATNVSKWYQVSPNLYNKTQLLPVFPAISDVDYVNGIMLDPRPLPGRKTVVLGNGRTAIIPDIGANRTFPRRGLWRRYLWE